MQQYVIISADVFVRFWLLFFRKGTFRCFKRRDGRLRVSLRRGKIFESQCGRLPRARSLGMMFVDVDEAL